MASKRKKHVVCIEIEYSDGGHSFIEVRNKALLWVVKMKEKFLGASIKNISIRKSI